MIPIIIVVIIIIIYIIIHLFVCDDNNDGVYIFKNNPRDEPGW